MQFNFFWSILLSPSSHRWASPLRILALQILPRYLILENLTCDILSCWSVHIYVHMFMYTCVCALLLSRVWFFVASWTVAYQAALSMGFSSKNTGVGCHFLLKGIFLTQGSNPHLLHMYMFMYMYICLCIHIFLNYFLHSYSILSTNYQQIVFSTCWLIYSKYSHYFPLMKMFVAKKSL